MAAILTGLGLGNSLADAEVMDMDSLPCRRFLFTPLTENEISDSVPKQIPTQRTKNLKNDHVK